MEMTLAFVHYRVHLNLVRNLYLSLIVYFGHQSCLNLIECAITPLFLSLLAEKFLQNEINVSDVYMCLHRSIQTFRVNL